MDLILFFKNNKFQSFWIIISSFLINVLALSSALYVIQVFNRYLNYKQDSTLFALTVGVIIAFLLELLLRLIRNFLVNKVTNLNYKKNAIEKLNIILKVRLNNNKANEGEKLINQTDPLEQNTVNTAEILIAFIDIFFVFIFLTVIFILSSKLGFISTVITALFIFVLYLKHIISLFLDKSLKKNYFRTLSVVNDTKRVPFTIRAFNAAKIINFKFRLYHARQRKAEKRVKNIMGIFSSINIMLPVLSTIIIIFYGAQEVTIGNLTIGALVGINILNSRIFGPINRISLFNTYILKQKKFKLTKKNKKNIDLENIEGAAPKLFKGNIALKDLAIGFNINKEILFQRLNCFIPSGSVTVINGYNSSGKSSLCNCLLGLIQPLKGNVLFDNTDIRNLNIENLRKNVSFLAQEVELLNFSIKENILLNTYDDGTKYNNDGMLIKVINMVGLDGYINSLKNGYNSIIENNGKNIPGGIKKRIGLARAIINDSKVLVLDEPTDSLDFEGIKKLYVILNNLRKLKKTLIIASHDKNIIKSADIIIDLSTKPIPRIGIRKKNL